MRVSSPLLLGIWTSLVSLSCNQNKDGHKGLLPSPSPEETSTVSFLFAPDSVPASQSPNIFKMSFTIAATGATIERRGELPETGAVVNITDLPVAADVSVTASLYRSTYARSNQTHSCKGVSSFDLIAEQINSLELECFALDTNAAKAPVHIFYKLAKGKLSIATMSASDFSSRRDWQQPSLFVGHDKDGLRISLRSFGTQAKLYVGGDIQYITATDEGSTGYRGLAETVDAYADGGRLIQSLPKKVGLTFLEPVLIESNDVVRLAVPFELKDSQELINVQGTLIEEPWASEFSVASYNVENLFDQTDDARNSSYGDYRITPNEQGQSSNWGAAIQINGHTGTFTEAKVLGIEQAILSIEPTGPSYINLQEIESKEALRQLFLVMQKHGYVDYKFTEMTRETETAIGLGVLSKFPILKTELIAVPLPTTTASAGENSGELTLRPIFKLSLEPKPGTTLTVYNNHWSSKGHPESYRLVYGKALDASIQELLRLDPRADYIVTGDLNCDYNERVTLDKEHNDTDGVTGLNSALGAQGDEKLVANGDLSKKYNLEYELPFGQRKSAWYPKTDWSSFDQVVIGTNMYDQIGYTYVDNSFSIASADSYSQGFLFDRQNHPRRWNSTKVDSKTTKHSLGGYSDHVPVSFRVYLPEFQSDRPIRLVQPGTPDLRDQSSN